MDNGNQILIKDFESKTFDEKKEKVILILRQLVGTNDIVNDLGELVYGITTENKAFVLLDVYKILLNAVDDSKKVIEEKKVNEIKDTLNRMKKEEENDRSNSNPDDILNSL